MEYIVVHELAHLLERHHNERFTLLWINTFRIESILGKYFRGLHWPTRRGNIELVEHKSIQAQWLTMDMEDGDGHQNR